MLRDRGYSTAAIVSSFLLRKETGINQGFNLFDANITAPNAAPSALRRDPLDAEAVAEHWLGSIGTQRTFLFLHLDGPHPPYREMGSGWVNLLPSGGTAKKPPRSACWNPPARWVAW